MDLNLKKAWSWSVWSYFPSCAHASESLGREEKGHASTFSSAPPKWILLQLLEGKNRSCCVSTEREGERVGEREAWLAIRLPRQQGTLHTWWWKKRRSLLIGIPEMPRNTFVHEDTPHSRLKGSRNNLSQAPKLNHKLCCLESVWSWRAQNQGIYIMGGCRTFYGYQKRVHVVFDLFVMYVPSELCFVVCWK